MTTVAGGATVPSLQRLRSLLAPRALLTKFMGALWNRGDPGGVGGVRGVVGIVLAYALVGKKVEEREEKIREGLI